ncbi:glycosyltransferase [Nakamurella flava]|uniref:Glycosyltransferase n=1 Tax=Nakamurella flava TaxID=2576308 RepID=A0A4U6QG41_9ACTN|nr:glycosyltransferase [Nakamurella flava]TKV59264.1 glycosyltransferase [Nakamurella flava]
MTARRLRLLVLAFLATKLGVLLANCALFPTLRPAGTVPHRRPRVALLVPLRNEAKRLPATLPGFLAAGADEVVFLDDESTDGCADLVRQHPRRADEPPVRVITSAPRPDGWLGKTWACQQLAATTTAERLVFVDADVHLAPGAVTAIVDEMDRQDAEVFSVFSRHLTGTWAERLLTPLIVDVVLCFLPFPALRTPVRAAATAHGAVLAFTRPAYDAVGGFAAVRAEVVEDIALARRTRRRGRRLGLALGGPVAQIRMYRGAREVLVGLSRGLVPVAGGSRVAVVAGWAAHVAVYTVPTALLLRRPRRWWPAVAMAVAERALVEAKTGGRDWAAALATPVVPLAAAPIVARSLRREQTWKGRTVVDPSVRRG